MKIQLFDLLFIVGDQSLFSILPVGTHLIERGAKNLDSTEFKCLSIIVISFLNLNFATDHSVSILSSTVEFDPTICRSNRSNRFALWVIYENVNISQAIDVIDSRQQVYLIDNKCL